MNESQQQIVTAIRFNDGVVWQFQRTLEGILQYHPEHVGGCDAKRIRHPGNN